MKTGLKLIASIAVGGALAAIAMAAPTRAAGDVLTASCSPPEPRTAANCDGWHTTSVTLYWGWLADYEQIPGTDCTSPHVFDADTPGTRVVCAVWKPDMSDPHSVAVTIHVDKTAPAVTGFTPDRPPDHDGWWNHPVSLQFTGTDATSGLADCDAVSYSGPDGATAPVAGTCRDVAGNAAAGTFPLKYDATPPMLGALPSDNTQVGRVTINWTTSADAVQTRVVRSPGIGTAPASEVYAGPDHTFTDTGVTGGQTYRYSLTSSDAAANTAAATIDVTARPAPRLRWRRVKGADYYNVQLYRGDRKILSVWPHLNQFRLHRTWTYRGRKLVLSPGKYHWYVWPGYGRRAEHRYGKLIAHRRFEIAPAPATR